MDHGKQQEKKSAGNNRATPPDTLLILGTDASGKNYVANFIENMIEASGYKVEKRDGWFSGKETDLSSSEDKSRFSLLLEELFLVTFPLTRPIIPILCGVLLRQDLKRFKKSDRKTIVVSHTALRVIAFFLGHVFVKKEEIRLAPLLERYLHEIPRVLGIKTIVLDIDDRIRKKRIQARALCGKMDNFDHYMASDGERSERIEEFLVWLGRTYLDAVVIENNDLDERELSDSINRAFMEFGDKSAQTEQARRSTR